MIFTTKPQAKTTNSHAFHKTRRLQSFSFLVLSFAFLTCLWVGLNPNLGAQEAYADATVAEVKSEGVDAATGGDEEQLVTRIEMVDFRGKLMLGYALVFALWMGYLCFGHIRNAKAIKEAGLLAKRIDRLESESQ